MKILNDFVRTTQPATYYRAGWRTLLRSGQAGPALVRGRHVDREPRHDSVTRGSMSE